MDASNVWLVVGLGNPGPQYAATRHNVGFWFVDALAKHWQVTLHKEDKLTSYYAKHAHNNSIVHLLQPLTFMNISGQPVSQTLKFYKIPMEHLVVVHDDLDLPVGTIRLKQDGGEGGHNGLRSISQVLGTRNYYRVRIGISHPRVREQVTNYVLHPPSSVDRTKITTSIDYVINNIISLIFENKIQQAMHILHSQDVT